MDNELTNLLREWQPPAPGASAIRRDVWRRIEHSEPGGFPALFGTLAALFSRPLVAAVFVAAAMTAGAVIGTGASAAAQTEAYLQSVSVFRHQP